MRKRANAEMLKIEIGFSPEKNCCSKILILRRRKTVCIDRTRERDLKKTKTCFPRNAPNSILIDLTSSGINRRTKKAEAVSFNPGTRARQNKKISVFLRQCFVLIPENTILYFSRNSALCSVFSVKPLDGRP